MQQINPQDVSPGDRKRFARERYRGVENLLIPSFAPDLTTLDEDGIRGDVRQSIAHGFLRHPPRQRRA